jgi:hypothetical protein
VKIYKDSRDSLIVRPIEACEESRWNWLMVVNHYLGFKGLIGEQIKYVAILNGEWVALLGWAASSYKGHSRDQWIGWSQYDNRDRLKFIANNWRFLILPEVKVRNLASKILALNLKRISSDWEKKYRHRLFLVETFVEQSRFEGTCYKANNWIKVGATRGFQKGHKSYLHHGKTKSVFLKPLTKDTRMRLKGADGNRPMVDIDRLPILGQDGLFEFLRTIKDHRKKKGLRHRSAGLLTVCLLAILSGAKEYKQIAKWGRSLSEKLLNNLLLQKAPSESTVRRFLMGLNTSEVDRQVTDWLLKHIDIIGQVIAFDGKKLRGSHNGEARAIELVAAVVTSSGIIISQSQTPDKTNEIPVVQNMLKELPLAGTTVTADALHTQEKTSQIGARDKGADMVFVFKDNQKNNTAAIKEALKKSAFSP